MEKIKLFSVLETATDYLERKVNDWLSKNVVEIVDIKITSGPIDSKRKDAAGMTTIMIIYKEVKEDENEESNKY